MEKTENLGRKITDYLSKSLVSFKVLGDKIKNFASDSKESVDSAPNSKISEKTDNSLSKIIKLENKEITKLESIEKEEKEKLFGIEELGVSVGKSFDKSFNKFEKKVGLSDFIKKFSKALDKKGENNSFGLFGGAIDKLRGASEENSGGGDTNISAKIGGLGGIGEKPSSPSKSSKGSVGRNIKAGILKGKRTIAQKGIVAGGSELLKRAGGTILGGTKFLGKSLTKKLPLGLGLAAGAIYAASRMADGDKMGAALETISGAASIIPGAGTVASGAVDGLIAARDNGVITDDEIKEQLKNIPGIGHLPGAENIFSEKELEELKNKNGGATLEEALNKNPSNVNTESRKFTSLNQSNYTSATSDRATANYNSTTLSLQPAIRQKEKVVSALKVDFEKEFGKDYVGGVGTIENDMNGNKFYYIHDELGNKNQVNKETYDKFVEHQQKLKKATEDLDKAKSDVKKAFEEKKAADKNAQLNVNIAEALEREGEESFAEEYLDSKGITKDPDEVDKDLALILSEEGVDQEPHGEIRLDFSEDDENLRLDQNADAIAADLAKIEKENEKKRIERTAEEDMRRKMEDGLRAEKAINETRASVVGDDYYLSTGQDVDDDGNPIPNTREDSKKKDPTEVKFADIKALGASSNILKKADDPKKEVKFADIKALGASPNIPKKVDAPRKEVKFADIKAFGASSSVPKDKSPRANAGKIANIKALGSADGSAYIQKTPEIKTERITKENIQPKDTHAKSISEVEAESTWKNSNFSNIEKSNDSIKGSFEKLKMLAPEGTLFNSNERRHFKQELIDKGIPVTHVNRMEKGKNGKIYIRGRLKDGNEFYWDPSTGEFIESTREARKMGRRDSHIAELKSKGLLDKSDSDIKTYYQNQGQAEANKEISKSFTKNELELMDMSDDKLKKYISAHDKDFEPTKEDEQMDMMLGQRTTKESKINRFIENIKENRERRNRIIENSQEAAERRSSSLIDSRNDIRAEGSKTPISPISSKSNISAGSRLSGSDLNSNAMKIEKGNSSKPVIISNNSPTTVSTNNVTANNNPPSTKNTDKTAKALNGFAVQ